MTRVLLATSAAMPMLTQGRCRIFSTVAQLWLKRALLPATMKILGCGVAAA